MASYMCGVLGERQRVRERERERVREYARTFAKTFNIRTVDNNANIICDE